MHYHLSTPHYLEIVDVCMAPIDIFGAYGETCIYRYCSITLTSPHNARVYIRIYYNNNNNNNNNNNHNNNNNNNTRFLYSAYHFKK